MKKRGMESSVFILALGVVALLVVSYLLFGKLLPKTKNQVDTFEKGKLPGDEPQTSSGSQAIPLEMLRYFDNLVSTIKKTENLNGLQCFVPLSEYPKSKDDYFVSLSSAGSISIKIKKGGEYGQTGELENIPGFNPCIVAWNGAENFYNNWLDGSIPSMLVSPEYLDNADANSLILFQSANKLKTPKEGGGREYEILDEDGKRYLYKPDKNHFCLIHATSGSCGLKGSSKAIGKDCFDTMLGLIKICGEPDKPAFIKELVSKGYNKNFRDAAIAFNDAVTQAVNSDKDVCKVEFSKYPGFNNQLITMFDVGGNLQIQADGKGSVILQTVTGYKPCIVHGQNFYGWLWNANQTAKVNQHIAKNNVAILGDGKNGVEFDPQDANGKNKRDLYKGRPLIYKTTDELGEAYICIIHRWGGGSCEKDKSKRNAVAQRCIEKKSPDYLESLGRTPTC